MDDMDGQRGYTTLLMDTLNRHQMDTLSLGAMTDREAAIDRATRLAPLLPTTCEAIVYEHGTFEARGQLYWNGSLSLHPDSVVFRVRGTVVKDEPDQPAEVAP